jgi:hypothetical protein
MNEQMNLFGDTREIPSEIPPYTDPNDIIRENKKRRRPVGGPRKPDNTGKYVENTAYPRREGPDFKTRASGGKD